MMLFEHTQRGIKNKQNNNLQRVGQIPSEAAQKELKQEIGVELADYQQHWRNQLELLRVDT